MAVTIIPGRNNTKAFSSLVPGDTFISGGALWMRIPTVKEDDGAGGEEIMNSISLATGLAYYFKSEETVEEVNIEIRID